MKTLFVLLAFCALSPVFSKEPNVKLAKNTTRFRVGGRLQGIFSSDLLKGGQDLYLRRTRVNLFYDLSNGHNIYADLRNDNMNQEDRGEGSLQFGDAFYNIPIEGSVFKNVRLYRAKVDVSYTQTSSSRNLITPERAPITDYAASFVVHNRRAANVQVNGGGERWTFQLAVSDGVHSDSATSYLGNVSVSSITRQNLTVGGKIRYYLWGEKVKPQESFYRPVDTLSVGVGAFHNPMIEYRLSNGTSLEDSRTLYNLELSLSVGPWRFLTEGFQFEGDLINLQQRLVGSSRGAYARMEYLIGKWAPYVGGSVFDRYIDGEGAKEENFELGLNWYIQSEYLRAGVVWDHRKGSALKGDSDRERLMSYVMVNY